MHTLLQILSKRINQQVPVAPLVVFRMVFGLLMLASVIRFWWYGWIEDLYITPHTYFPFIEGLAPLPGWGMYAVFLGMAIASTFILMGLFYRYATISFFLLFSYVELLDKSNYLNHYYFVSLISFLMIWLPAQADFSLDVKRKAITCRSHIPVVYIDILKLQLGILYFFAGIAKINYDWLLRAQPLRMWLAVQAHKPLIGWLFQYKATAFFLSWAGMLYDISIPFLLITRRFRLLAYSMVVAFHLLTWWLFPIGMFPFIMIGITTIFLPSRWHEHIVLFLKSAFRWATPREGGYLSTVPALWKYAFAFYLFIQVLLPIRYLIYPGDLFWTEQGYRFSWRVMLMEKSGFATLYVRDKDSSQTYPVANYEHLTPQQEKMMSTQPDMILQYAKYLEKHYMQKGMQDPVVTADVYVTINGHMSRRLVDPSADLTQAKYPLFEPSWILRYD